MSLVHKSDPHSVAPPPPPSPRQEHLAGGRARTVPQRRAGIGVRLFGVWTDHRVRSIILTAGCVALILGAGLGAWRLALDGQARSPTPGAHARAITDANRALTAALTTLDADGRALAANSQVNELFSDYVTTWSLMQADYQRELTDAQLGCSSRSQAQDDATRVESDARDMQALDDASAAQQEALATGVIRVQADMQSVEAATQRLQLTIGAVGRAGSASLRGAEVIAALSHARGQLAVARMARQRALQASAQWGHQASQLRANARRVLGEMGCATT